MRVLTRAFVAAAAGALLAPGVLLADQGETAPVAPSQPPPSTVAAPVSPGGDSAAVPPGDGAAATAQPAPAAAPAQASPPEVQTTPSSALTAPPPKVASTRRQARVRAAAAGGVLIQNFLFAPRTIDVTVGDTVTWTNRDSVVHTATATGGGFNTGTIKAGKSASVTFSKPGTFAYICAVHPNMHGTVVVAGASAGGGSSSAGSGSGSTSGSGPATPAASSTNGETTAAAPSTATAATLPNTGIQVGLIALAGALLGGSGLFLRRLTGRG